MGRISNLKSSKRGFTLAEVLAAGLILIITSVGIAGMYAMEYGLLLQTSHRMQAINYARGIAGVLLEEDINSGKLAIGTHDKNTDPDICTLPDSYFKIKLKGEARYIVDDYPVEAGITARRVRVILEWKELMPKRDMEEDLYFVAFFSD